MKNYIYTKSSTLIAFDSENINAFITVPGVYGNLDYMYLIHEDGIFHFDNENKYDVKKGDIVYIMYPVNRNKRGYDREVIVVSNEKLYDYYLRMQVKEQEEEKTICCDPCKCSCTPCEAEA